ncbi:MAG: hypothetical protein IPO00_13030 [Betaproteobacteria bacterium]|nr:hypothetical protein [Betaproteobacteria bacterium]
MPDEEYRAMSAGMSAYVMNNDDDRPTYARLSEIIQYAAAAGGDSPSGPDARAATMSF